MLKWLCEPRPDAEARLAPICGGFPQAKLRLSREGRIGMEENARQATELTADAPKKNKLLSWLDNFWYHYKWHSLIALFLVFTVTICTVQTCSRQSYDIHIVYAGSKNISRTAKDGDVAEYVTMLSSFKQVVSDYDGDGEINVELLDSFMLTNEEIAEIERAGGDESVNYTLINNNKENLEYTMMYSSNYLCFLSDSLYRQFSNLKINGERFSVFTSIAPYVSGGTPEYLDEGAIYLRSTAFAALPGICDLPDNTVICIRALNAYAGNANKSDNEEAFKRSEETLRKILSYGN